MNLNSSNKLTGQFTNQLNTGLQNINSFVTSNLKNAQNSIKNTMSNIVSPVTESINATTSVNSMPGVSIAVIITLGILIVSFILVVIFRSQISIGIESVWAYLKHIFGFSTPSIIPLPGAYVPDDGMDNSIIDKVLPGKKEVFNVAQNKYTYSDAEPLCKAFGAELATYDQVKEAWNKGADWCNYGWVKGQTAVYPTQQSTFDKLQQGTEDQRMACGMPGINGGYFDNPELRFGVNCYGVKPAETDNDRRNIMSEDGTALTPGVLAYDKKILDYKAHMDEIPINPFKEGIWTS